MKKIIALLLLLTVGCTDNSSARRWGGTVTEKLPIGKKLVNLTWKDSSLWILARPMRADEVAETYEFKEKSSLGIMEGTVVIVETKPKQPK